MELQQARLEVPAKPGVAFQLVKKLLAFNTAARNVEVVMLSRNDPVSALRFSARPKGRPAPGARVFTQGATPSATCGRWGAPVFVGQRAGRARGAGAGLSGCAGADRIGGRRSDYPTNCALPLTATPCCSRRSRARVPGRRAGSLSAHEISKAEQPLPGGPFKPLLAALHQLQQQAGRHAPAHCAGHGAQRPAHERAINTLMDWNMAVDEAMFLGGLEKGPFLREFEPDFFFDDQTAMSPRPRCMCLQAMCAPALPTHRWWRMKPPSGVSPRPDPVQRHVNARNHR
jgi:5'-nucleotidase